MLNTTVSPPQEIIDPIYVDGVLALAAQLYFEQLEKVVAADTQAAARFFQQEASSGSEAPRA